MPDLLSFAANIRTTGGFHSETYVTSPTEPVVFSRAVNMASITYPVTTITFDNPYSGVGATSDVLVDMELRIMVGNTSVERGRLRVAEGGASATVLQVEEFSRGRISIADNDRIDVLRSWRVRTKLVGATAAFPKDSRIAYTDAGSNPAPIACSGGHWVGFTDAGQIFATVPFVGTDSLNVDPDTSATLTHLWTIGDGTFTVGTSTSASPTATFPVGERWVSHRVTAANGKQTTQYVYVRVFNETTTRPTDCANVQLSADRTNSWRCTFSVPGGRTLTELPDGALIIIWEREYRNSTPTSAGTVVSYGSNATGRSHIKFVGYLQTDSIREDPRTGTVSFEAVNPIALMKDLPGFSQVILRRTSPANWRGVKTLTTNRALIYMLRWHSSLLTSHDLVLSADNFNYPAFYIQANALDAQVREIVDGVDGEWICDRAGRIVVQQNLRLATSAERTAATTTWTFTDQDIAEVDLGRNHRLTYSQLEGRGFTAAVKAKSAQPRISIAPGTAPAEASQKTVVEKLIVTDQADLNTRTGYRYAAQNGTYNGLPTSRGSITLPGSYDVFDLYAEWIKVTLAASYNKRGIAFSSTRFVIENIQISYNDNGTKVVRLTVNEETDGVAGTTKKIKSSTEANVPSYTLPTIEFPYYPPIVPTGVNIGVGTMAVFEGNGFVYITSDFNVPEPAYTAFSLGMSGTAVGMAVDAYSPKYLTGTGAVNVWIVTTTNIYRVADVFGARTLTNLRTFGYSTALRTIAATRLTQNFVATASNRLASGGVVVDYTTDGTTWNTVTVSSFYNTTTGSSLLRGNEGTPCIQLSEHVNKAGHAYVGAYTATGAAQAATVSLYESANFCASFAPTSKIIGAAQWPLRGLYLPYHDNDNDNIMYYTMNDTATTIVQERRNEDGTQTVIDPYAGASKAAASGANNIHASPVNRQNMVAIMTRPAGSEYGQTPYVTQNGGDTWIKLDDEGFFADDRWSWVSMDGTAANMFYTGTLDGNVFVSTDMGVSIIDHSGNTAVNGVIGIVGN